MPCHNDIYSYIKAAFLRLQGVVLPEGYTAEVKARERVGSDTAAIRLDTVGAVPTPH